MRVRDALDRLDAIYDQMDRAEGYRGLRAAGVAAAGAVGLAAAAAQPAIAGPGADGFAAYWVAVAGCCAALAGGPTAAAAVAAPDPGDRRRARRVCGQFLPCVVAGAILTAALNRLGGPTALLPGLWAVVFGLGVTSARPYLPASVGWVGPGYLAAGVGLLATAGAAPFGWAVGGVFGVGHLATAWCLVRDRKGDADDEPV